jgi:hypothetical protein
MRCRRNWFLVWLFFFLPNTSLFQFLERCMCCEDWNEGRFRGRSITPSQSLRKTSTEAMLQFALDRLSIK